MSVPQTSGSTQPVGAEQPVGSVLLGSVLAVCAVHAERIDDPKKGSVTAIDKRAVGVPVAVGPLGLSVDHVCDTAHHGGTDQAVYLYSESEARGWSERLGLPTPPGWFGENLRIDGPSTDLVVGTRLRVGAGGLELEVTIPRTPCQTFARWVDANGGSSRGWVRRFTEQADVGVYAAVITPGPVRAGDRIVAIEVPRHGASARDLFTGSNPEALGALAAEPQLRAKVRRDVTARLGRNGESRTG